MINPELIDYKAAYEVADENGKKMLRALYPEVFTTAAAENRPVTTRIKTFEGRMTATRAQISSVPPGKRSSK